MPKRINKAQRIQLDRLDLSTLNGIQGSVVAQALKENKHLWDCFVFGRSGRYGVGELIELRDLTNGIVNADEVLILTDKTRWDELLEVIEGWNAEQVGYISGDGQELWGTAPYNRGDDIGEALGCSSPPADLILVRVWWS